MLRVLDPGMLNTIQDAGRWGYQAYGVPVSGAMDSFALRVANALVGNSPGAAALELHSHITLVTDQPHLLALAGADATVEISGQPRPQWTSLFVRAGESVEVRLPAGGWCYLAVHGGVDVATVLGSKSTYLRGRLGGLDGRALELGDSIPVGKGVWEELVPWAGRQASERVRSWAKRESPVRILPGPYDDWFADDAVAALVSAAYQVAPSSDRMGYRLQGSVLTRRTEEELISCGVPLGAIQVPPDGQPIVLMADHQTTGGYPIIATVVSADIPILAQCRVGESLRFRVAEPDEDLGEPATR